MARVTEKKDIDIDHTCVDNPVYLNWLNSTGGRDVWLFKKVQTRSRVIEVNGQFQPVLRDIENAQGYIQNTSVDSTPRLTIGAEVEISKLQGIEGLLDSLNVLMLMNPTTWEVEGVKWQIVRVLPGTFRLNNTDQKRHTIELTIELPFKNIQAQ